ncbi:phage protein Gp37 [Roseospira navarrensis]|uniref:DUF1834 family protein n=1 Tax=Roseospira navarrensis TaxID=140058 RepID=A0A7X2D550_9PROT|nr:phage protein Gp37 [Roseospira navarrensis]MQX36820.1 DUF1834 family protein [Roseospira navarrensis]
MIGAVEDAIIARLRAAADAGHLGYAWGALGTYRDELDEDVTAILRQRFPAAWVAFSRLDRHEDGRGELWRARYVVVVAARSGRNEHERRHGADDRVGAYQLAEDVCALLHDQALGLEIEPIQVEGVRPLLHTAARDQRLAAYGIDLTTAWTLASPPDADAMGEFLTFHGDWDLPVHGNVTPDADGHLPAPEADARDTIHRPEDP